MIMAWKRYCRDTKKEMFTTTEIRAKIKILTAWKIGSGPCGPTCDYSDIGRWTNDSRKQLLVDNCATYLGAWNVEKASLGDDGGSKEYIDKTAQVTSTIVEKVQLLNRGLKWEMEQAEITITVPIDAKYMDMKFQGKYWVATKINQGHTTNLNAWFLQTKIKTAIRSDTGKSNRSPVLQIKPYYRFLIGNTTTVSIPYIDQDNDIVRCTKAGIGTSNGIQAPRGLSIDEGDCLLTFDLSTSNRYQNLDTGIILIDVMDFNKDDITLTSGNNTEIFPAADFHATSLSTIPLQFYFEVVDRLFPPIFIDPTPEDRQLFEIYVGAMFSVEVFASPTDDQEHVVIDQFLFTRRDGIKVTKSDMLNRTEIGPRVRSLEMTWVPLKSEIGKHLLCAFVIDTQGNDSPLRCYSITVKEFPTKPVVPLIGQPYFIQFPTDADIACKINSICRFPIYAKTDNPGGIQSISIVRPELFELHKAGPLTAAPPEMGQNVSMVEISFRDPVNGIKEFCAKATDRYSSTEQCTTVQVKPPDPCLSFPCQNSGECITTEDSFTCICKEATTGQFCENIDKCNPNPCRNGGECYNGYCICKDSKTTGLTCENDFSECNDQSCQGSICADRKGRNPAYECLCTDLSHGTSCQNSSSSFIDCILTPYHQKCKYQGGNRNCSSGIVVKKDVSSTITQCICPQGFTDPRCIEKIDTSQERNALNARFVIPTMAPGTVIICDPLSGGADSDHETCLFPVFVYWNGKGKKPSIEATQMPSDMILDSATRAILLRGIIPYEAPGFSHTFTGTVVVVSKNGKTFEEGMHYICLQVTQDAVPTDNRCFNVNVKIKVLKYAKKEVRSPGRKFVRPTLPPHSVILCAKDSNCHINVYTEFKSDCLPPHLQLGLPCLQFGTVNISMFETGSSPQPVCHTDISYNTGGMAVGTEHELCLLASEHGESRCFTIKVTENDKDVCSPVNPCQNDGLCIALEDGTYNCMCKKGFSGNSCQNGKCPPSGTTSKNCEHQGHCHTDGVSSKCFCQLGTLGESCDHQTNENITSTGQTEAKFIGAALPTVIKCNLGHLCDIPSVLTGKPNEKPSLKEGFVDSGVEVQGIKVEKDNSSSHTYHSVTTVMPKSTGQHKVCVQSTTPRGTSDELCYIVEVTSSPPAPVSKKGPYYIPPTLGDGSTIECSFGQPCHLTLWTKNTAIKENCPEVESDMGPEDGVYVFQPKALSPCSRDVSFHTDVERDFQSCFQLVEEDIKGDGEKRCYTIKIMKGPLHAQGPCGSSVVCQHGGFCSGRTNPAQCHCPFGFSGSRCHVGHGDSLTKPSTQTTPTTGDMALPKKVVCYVHEECSVPVSITSPKLPTLRPSQVDQDLLTKEPVVTPDPNSTDTYVGHVTVTGKTPGVHKSCVQVGKTTASDRTTTEEICFEVELKMPDSNHRKPKETQPHFVAPTLSHDSVTQCVPGMSCHVLMFMSAGAYPECPLIKQTQGPTDDLHLFTTSSYPNCSADVTLNTPSDASGQLRFCFNTYLPNVPGETRCFYVKFEDFSAPSPSCTGVTCKDSSQCDIVGGQPKCICALSQSGSMCGTSGSNGPPHTSVHPKITDFPLPKLVRCEVGKECQIPMMINYGGPNLPSVTTTGAKLSPKLTVITKEPKYPDGVYKVMMPVTPTEEGQHKLCASVATGGTHCVTIEAFTTVTSTPAPTGVYFEQPTLPSESSVVCQHGNTCHLIMYHKPNNNGKCDPSVGTLVPGSAHVITPLIPNSQNLCETDIVYTAENGMKSQKICIKASGVDGENRCYSVDPSMNITKPCDTVNCNHGVCVEKEEITQCKCKIGFMGDNCNTDTKNFLTGQAVTKTGFVDSVLPKKIVCYTGQPCQVPLVVHNNGTERYKDVNLEIMYGRGPYNIKVTNEKTNLQQNVTSVPGSNTSIAVIETTDSSVGTEETCVVVEQAGKQKDRLCYNIEYITGPPPSQTDPKFTNPSLGPNSKISCEAGVTCHLIVETSKQGGTCPKLENSDPNSPSDSITDVFVFDPDDSQPSGSCKTDIAIKPTLSELGEKRVCVTIPKSPGSADATRCYQMEVKKGDACKPISCKNGGKCDVVNDNEGIAVCICPLGFSGDRCQNAKEEAVTPFNEQEIQSPDKQKGTPKFTGMALPETITCIKDQPCTLPLRITDPQGTIPALGFGTVDPGIITRPPTVTPLGGNTFTAGVEVIPTNLGKRKVCVQTKNTEGTNMDEICYTIKTIGTDPNTSPEMPKMLPPTIGENSVVVCQPGHTCHIPLTYEKSGSQCASISETTDAAGVNVFQDSSSSGRNCTVDIGFTPSPDGGGTKQLCFQPKPNGERRCITAKIEETSSVASTPCQTKHCHRDGFCSVQTGTQAVCTCKTGSTGPLCSTDSTESLIPSTNSNQEPTLVDISVPKEIKCYKGTECLIPFAVKGSQTIVGDTDPGLTPTMKPGSKIQTTDNVNEHVLSVKPNSEGKKSVCVKTKDPEQMCFTVDVVDPPVDTSTAPKFTGTTLGPESTVTCLTEHVCHLQVQTDKVNGSCPAILETTGKTTISDIHIFPTQTDNCTTDVAFKPSTTETGEKELCVQLIAGSGTSTKERERCFKVQVDEKQDPCMSVYCKNNGECHVTNDKGHCVCPPGFSGEKCQTEGSLQLTAVDLTVPELSQEKPHFTDLAIPKVVKCVQETPCHVPLHVTDLTGHIPIVHFGSVDPGLDTHKPVLTPVNGTKSFTTDVVVTPQTSGNKTVCVQTATSDGTSADEICYIVETSGLIPKHIGNPKYLAPTLTDTSVLQCEIGKMCHIPLIYQESGQNCEAIQEYPSHKAGVHVFQPPVQPSINKTCTTDVGYTPPDKGPVELCFKPGSTGEKICYKVVSKQPTDKYSSPCQHLHCKKNGVCVTDQNENAKCVCQLGSSGKDCDQDSTNFVTEKAPRTKPAFTDLVLPQNVNCYKDKPCTLPFVVTAKGPSVPTVNLTNVGTDLNPSGSLTPTNINGTHSYSTELTATPTATGDKKACIQTVESGTLADETCFTVHVTDPPGEVTINPKFTDKTYKKESVLHCMVGQDCHLPMETTTDQNGKCPTLSKETSAIQDIHPLGPVQTGAECKTDVVLRPSETETGTQRVCIKINVSPSEDARCYIFNVTEDKQSPCHVTPCLRGGHCTETGNQAVCTCPVGSSGTRCNTDSTNSTIPVTDPTQMPKFVDTVVPKEVKCYVNKECLVPLTVIGSQIPVVGETDTTLQTSIKQGSKINSTDNVHQHTLSITPQTMGRKPICVKASDQMCFTVDVVEPPTDTSTVPKFNGSTLGPDSTIYCQTETLCHLPIQTEALSPSGNCPEIFESGGKTTISDVHIFPTQPDDCKTDVAFKPSTSETGEKKLCVHLKSGSGSGTGEREICYKVQVDTKQDPCSTVFCGSNGECQASSVTCMCKAGFTGSKCEQEKHGQATKVDLTSPKLPQEKPHFTDFAVPKVINCVLNTPCPVPLEVTDLSGKIPTVHFGSVDPGLDTHKPALTPVNGTNSFTTDIVITPQTLGNKTVCVQTAASDGTSVDEICYNVQTQATKNIPLGQPQYTSPTVNNASELLCEVGQVCHIPLSYMGSQQNCESVKEVPSQSTNIHVFAPLHDRNKTCKTEVSYKPTTAGTEELCFKPGSYGEKRCFKIVSTLSGDKISTPCQKLHCKNNGICVTDDQNAPKCVCKLGTSGDLCEKDSKNYVTPGKNKTEPAFTDLVYPKKIVCYKNQPCTVPLVVTSPGGPPTVDFGNVSPDLQKTGPLPPSGIANTHSYNTEVNVTSPTNGQKEVCVQTKDSSSKKVDEVCVKVEVIDPPVIPVAVTPKFTEKTFNTGSILHCKPDQDCHLPMETTTDQNGKCPSLSKESKTTIQDIHPLETEVTSTSCKTDFVIHPNISETGEQTVCIQINASPSEGPRCYKFNVTEDKLTPCQMDPCFRGGLCTVTANQTKCTCPLGSTGPRCKTDSSKSIVPVTNGGQEPKFVDTVIPKEVKCYLNKDCLIPLAVKGSSTPTLGDHDSSLSPKINPGQKINSTDGVYQHSLLVNPQSKGKRQVCVQANSPEQMCFTVDVVDPPTDSLTAPHFTGPTLEPGSTMSCQTDTVCHLLVQTEKENGKCPDILANGTKTTISDVHVFPTESNDCTTDVAIRPSSTETGEKGMCVQLKLGSEERERCYVVHVDNKTDPCSTMFCGNQGECHVTNGQGQCACRPGFGDSKCMTEQPVKVTGVDLTSSQLTAEKPQFTDLAVPTVINCVLDTPCHVPLKVTDPSGSIPSLHFGKVDSGIDTLKPVVTPLTPGNNNKDYTTDVIVTPHTTGNKSVCVQTVTAAGTNVDEICYIINTNASGPPSTGTPSFTPPTLSHASEVRCEIGEVCHIPLTYQKSGQGCDHVEEVPTSNTDVHVFSPVDGVNHTCQTDVAYKPLSTGPVELCFKPGVNGEKRCLKVVSSQHGSKVSTPCQTLHCENNGVCVTDDQNSPKCVCPLGRSGPKCNSDSTNYVTDGSNKTQPAFTDLVYPKNIICYKNQPCIVPFVVTSSGSKPTIQTGTIDPDLQTTGPKIPTILPNTHSYTTDITLTPQTTGEKKACIRTTDSSSNVDEICMNITVTDPPTPPPVGSPTFTDKTFKPDSILHCKADQDCHLPMETTTKTDGQCPSLSKKNSTIKDIQPLQTEKSANSECTTDFVLHPDLTEVGSQTVCIQMNVNPPHGVRCYKFEITPDVDATSTVSTPTTPTIVFTSTDTSSQVSTATTVQLTVTINSTIVSPKTSSIESNTLPTTLTTSPTSKTAPPSTPQTVSTPLPATQTITPSYPQAASVSPTTQTFPPSYPQAASVSPTTQTFPPSYPQAASVSPTTQTFPPSYPHAASASPTTQAVPPSTQQTASAPPTTKAVPPSSKKTASASPTTQAVPPSTQQTASAPPTTQAVLPPTTPTASAPLPATQTVPPSATATVSRVMTVLTSAPKQASTVLSAFTTVTSDTTKPSSAVTTSTTKPSSASVVQTTSTTKPSSASVVQTTVTTVTGTASTVVSSTQGSPSSKLLLAALSGNSSSPSVSTTSPTTNGLPVAISNAQSLPISSTNTQTPQTIIKLNPSSPHTTTQNVQTVTKNAQASTVSGTSKKSTSVLAGLSTSSSTQQVNNVPNSPAIGLTTSISQPNTPATVSSTSSSTSPINTLPNGPVVGQGQCMQISPETMKEAAESGRMSCKCKDDNGDYKEVIKPNPKATTTQLLKAAGIGAGSVSGAMLIAFLIYLLVSKVKGSSDSNKPPTPKPRKVNPSRRNQWH